MKSEIENRKIMPFLQCIEDIRYLRFLEREDMINKSLMSEEDYNKTLEAKFKNNTENVMDVDRFIVNNGGSFKEYNTPTSSFL